MAALKAPGAQQKAQRLGFPGVPTPHSLEKVRAPPHLPVHRGSQQGWRPRPRSSVTLR